MGLNMILPLAGGLAVAAVLVVVVLVMNRTAYLGPVKEELQKEKGWLRRGEYNAAMVKGRQNLELLLRLVAEKNGIQLDNSAKAQANAREAEGRRNQNGGGNQFNGQNRSGRKKTPKVMTYQQFNRWLSENGYLDRVARWEMNQVRLIGNKAAHENYADKDDAWNQFNYLEDILKTITERSQNPKKRQEQAVAEQEMPKKNKRRRKKKKNAEKAVEVKQAAPEQKQEEKKETEQAEVKKKSKRRRRKKKPQSVNAAAENTELKAKPKAEPKTAAEPVKSEPVPAEGEQKPKKRRRRRRPRKPQEQQGQQAQAKETPSAKGSGKSSGE